MKVWSVQFEEWSMWKLFVRISEGESGEWSETHKMCARNRIVLSMVDLWMTSYSTVMHGRIVDDQLFNSHAWPMFVFLG